MTEQRKMTRPMQVIGPDSELMTLAISAAGNAALGDTPQGEVVAAVRGGLVTSKGLSAIACGENSSGGNA